MRTAFSHVFTGLAATAGVGMICLLTASAPPASAQNAPTDRLDTPALLVDRPQTGLIVDIARVNAAATGRAVDRLAAVGDRGRILISDDAAETWRQTTSPVSVELTAIAFNDAGVGVAVGHDGVILRSPDAGETWRVVADGRALFPRAVDAAKKRVTAAEAALEVAEEDARGDAEFALEDEQFRLETAEASISFGPAWPFLDVYWSDAATVWAIGAYGLAFLSETGGEEWRLVADRFDNFEDFHFYSMLKTRAGALLAVGEAGVIFRSGDKGRNWERFDTDDGVSLFGVAEIGAPETPIIIAYGFGDSYQVSTDDGETWEGRDLGATSILVGHVASAADAPQADRLRALGASGQMVELGADGVGRRSQPTEDRSFLSVGVELSATAPARLVLGSEAGLHVTVVEAE